MEKILNYNILLMNKIKKFLKKLLNKKKNKKKKKKVKHKKKKKKKKNFKHLLPDYPPHHHLLDFLLPILPVPILYKPNQNYLNFH